MERGKVSSAKIRKVKKGNVLEKLDTPRGTLYQSTCKSGVYGRKDLEIDQKKSSDLFSTIRSEF